MASAASGKTTPYEKIRDAIVTGEFAPGDALVESALAAWCEVSRTPVREALRRLEQDGLVTWGERGLVVREHSAEEILDIYEVRMSLEALAARTAAERRTDHDVRLLRAAVGQGDNVAHDDPAELVRHSRSLHQYVQRAAHNEALGDLLDRVNLHLTRYSGTRPTLSAPGRWASAHDEHIALVDAIERRDADAAYQIAYDHFAIARDIRVQMFAEDLS
jgi:DNA-binding GntR family transcriptional regulator